MIKKMISISMILVLGFLFPLFSQFLHGKEESPLSTEELLMKAMHNISSHTLLNYIKELTSEKYSGRLTGTSGYNSSAQWISNLFKKWEIKPGGDNATYFQEFPNPYTNVLPGAYVKLLIHFKDTFIEKNYQYEKDYFPGATSDAGEIKAEVIYVGYGITAPELKYDDYKGVNVKGKIVLMEREVPISSKDVEEFKKWLPYSFHDYKTQNAFNHGAAGILYNYHIVNPNNIFIKKLLFTNVGKTIVNDIFKGTGKIHQNVIDKIKSTRKPCSFKTGKIISMGNVTEHHPEGIAKNVIGYIEGSDPECKKKAILIGAHLDHLGLSHRMMPGADDNASGVAAVLGIAKAIKESKLIPQHSIVFILFGAEEQGVKGSEFYLKHPLFAKDKTIVFFNLDGVGRGNKIITLAGKNYPEFLKYIEDTNNKYIHRQIIPRYFHNQSRPRLDAAHFERIGIPNLSFFTTGAESLPYSYYHTTRDNIDIITPEILEDLAQLLFISTMNIAGY